jgi:hypothetical protein
MVVVGLAIAITFLYSLHHARQLRAPNWTLRMRYGPLLLVLVLTFTLVGLTSAYLVAEFSLRESVLNFHNFCPPVVPPNGPSNCVLENYSSWAENKIQSYGNDWNYAVIEMVARSFLTGGDPNVCFIDRVRACALAGNATENVFRTGVYFTVFGLMAFGVSICGLVFTAFGIGSMKLYHRIQQR